MTEKEELIIQYEDAAFALLMHEAAAVQGKRALEENKALKQDDGSGISAHLDRRSQQTIERRLSQKQKKDAGRISHILKKLIPAVCLLAVLFSTVVVGSPTLWEQTFNVLLPEAEKSETIQFGNKNRAEEKKPHEFEELSVGWVPDGYRLVSSGKSDNGQVIDYYYQQTGKFAANASIHISKMTGDMGGVVADANGAETEYIDVNGNPVLLIERSGAFKALLTDSSRLTFILFASEGLSREQVIKIFNSIRYS